MPREKLDDPGYDEETFEETMDNLSVEIVKPKTTEVEWYQRSPKSNRFGGLSERISFNASGITIGGQAIKKFPSGYVSVGVVEVKGKKTMVIKPAKDGFKITMSTKNSHRCGSKALVVWLESKGIKKGTYELREAGGGYIAVLVGGANGR